MMRCPLCTLALWFFVAGGVGSLLGAEVGQHRPVILDTDIGTDIDDSWALAYLLRSPALDLRLVLTDTGDPHYRGAIAAKLLEAAGRTDIPVGLGKNFGPMKERDCTQAAWVKDYALDKYPGHVIEDGIGALIDLVMKSDEPITIIAIGAVPNIAIALQREPRIAARCRLVGMQGSFDLGYGGKPPAVAEANVVGDPASLRAVLAAPWKDILLTPLDTCGTVTLEGDNYQAIWETKEDLLIKAVLEDYRAFAPRVAWMKVDYVTSRSTVLFDCVAVYLAQSESEVEVERVKFRVTDSGFTVRDPAGVSARVALRWKDRAAFEKELTDHLLRRTP